MGNYGCKVAKSSSSTVPASKWGKSSSSPEVAASGQSASRQKKSKSSRGLDELPLPDADWMDKDPVLQQLNESSEQEECDRCQEEAQTHAIELLQTSSLTTLEGEASATEIAFLNPPPLEALRDLEGRYRHMEELIDPVLGIRSYTPTKTVLQKLRSHTRRGYVDGAFEDILGEQPLRGNELNEENVSLAGENTDFGHFIASLAGQYGGSTDAAAIASIVIDIGSGVSWGGDLGTVVISMVDGNQTLNEAMAQFASDADLSADIAAVVVGSDLSGGPPPVGGLVITDAVEEYNRGSFSDHVRTFARIELKGRFDTDRPVWHLTNTEYVKDNIRSGIHNFLVGRLLPLIRRNPINAREILRNEITPEHELAIIEVAEEFLKYLSRKGDFSY